MKKSCQKLIISLLLFAILLSSLFSCTQKPKKFETTWFDYFDTFSTLTVYTDTQEQFDEYAALCHSMLKEYHQLLDIYHDYEGVVNLKAINDTTAPLTIDAKLGEFLSFGKEMHTLTGGYTNIAMGSVLRKISI